MKLFLISLLSFVISFSIKAQEGPTLNEFFDKADAFFDRYTNNGLVHYEAVKNNDDDIKELVEMIEVMDLTNATEDEKIAFAINTYNLLVIYQVKENLPIKSVTEVKGFFDKEKFEISGEKYTLNEFESNVIFGKYFDVRYHFVLVCGAVGCPPITEFAYRPDKLEGQLHRQTRKFVTDQETTRINDNAKTIYLNEIFNWYRDHFEQEYDLIADFLNEYLPKTAPVDEDYALKFYEYDWTLNDTFIAKKK